MSNNISVVINAVPLAIPDGDQQPFIRDGRVYVPLRAAGESLDCEVDWVRETRQVVITTGGRDGAPLPARTGDRQAVQIVVDGQVKEFPADYGKPFVTAAGRTVIPLRAVGEALDCAVDWNIAARQAAIRSRPKPPPPPPPPAPSRGPEEYGETRPAPPPGGGLLPELAAYRTNIFLLDGTRINSAELLGQDEASYSQAQLDQFQTILNQLRPYDMWFQLPDGREWATAELTILGPAVATARQLRAWLDAEAARNRVRMQGMGREFIPFPDLVDLYLRIGAEYGVRGDLALAQSSKETGYWQFTGLVQPDQNNYCGLWATGSALTGGEPLNGADPSRVFLEAGRHGATFATPEAGVEAHIQHLYAYATTAPLPPGKVLLSPRFTYVQRGCAPTWQGLNARWAVPGTTYGQSIIHDYWLKALYH